MSKFSGTRRALTGCMLLPAAFALLAACSDSVAPTTAAQPSNAVPASYTRWSDSHSWPGGVVPKAGDDVVIPEGTRMVLDVSPAAIRRLTVRGELVIGDADVALSASRIDVFGSFVAGAVDHPYTHHLTITLTDGTTDDLRKGILVQAGGRLDLFGEPRITWARLTATANAGATSITVDSTTHWRAGDRIVVAPSDADQDHAEVAELARDADAGTLTLAQPLRFYHWGVTQTVAGRTLDERAEVGLLSHNIVIQGDANSEKSGIGAHVMVMWQGTAHVDGVEFYRGGQRGVLARYPFHWHLAGDVPGQYVKRSSVWHSFSRCMTIHGTNDALLEDNVCYDHVGHGFFVEDGIEHDNIIRDNVAMVSHPGTLIPTDNTPANFWITNPDNTVEGNVAAGSAAFGIWIAPVYHPTGPSATSDVWPTFTPLRKFANNTVHSTAGDGVHVEGPADAFGMAFTDYRPRDDAKPDGAPVDAVLSGLTVYKTNRGIWARGDHVTIENSVFADNRTGIQIGDAALMSDSHVRNTLLVGASDNAGDTWTPVGFRLYDGGVHLEHLTFANFTAGGSAIATLPGFDGRMSALNTATDLRFTNAKALTFVAQPTVDGEGEAVLQDLDGSLTGHVGGAAMANWPVALDAGCAARTEWGGFSCSTPRVALWVTNGLNLAPATVVRDDGVRQPLVGSTPNALTLNVPAARTYDFTPTIFTGTHFTLETEGLAPGQWIIGSMPWPREPGATHGFEPGVTSTIVTSRAALDASTSTAVWFDTSAQRVYIRFVGTAAARHQMVGVTLAGQTF